MQDLPENHLRVSGASWVNIITITSRDDNPADDASKGLRLQEMAKDNRWMNGPTFLWKEEDSWPIRIEFPRLKDSVVQVRKESRIYVAAVAQDPLDILIHHYSSWWKLKRTFAWLLRYKQFIRSKTCKKKKMPPLMPSALLKKQHSELET